MLADKMDIDIPSPTKEKKEELKKEAPPVVAPTRNSGRQDRSKKVLEAVQEGLMKSPVKLPYKRVQKNRLQSEQRLRISLDANHANVCGARWHGEAQSEQERNFDSFSVAPLVIKPPNASDGDH